MGKKEQRNVRILVRPKNQSVQEAFGVEKEDNGKNWNDFLDEKASRNFEGPRQLVDIGLDISTVVVGITILDSNTSELISMEAVKLNKARFKDVWDKADHIHNALTNAFDLVRYKANRIFVEEAHMKFTPGFSSAKTLFTLSRFNGIVSYQAHKLFGVKPIMVNVRTARKILGIKINRKDKSKTTKDKVFEIVRTRNPDFPWEQHIAKTGHSKGQMVYGKENYDISDAWVICKGGQLIYPQKKTK